MADDQGHTFHIMWHCDAAQQLWGRLRRGWEHLGVQFGTTTTDFCTAVFSLRLRQTPPAAWTLLGLDSVADDVVPLVHQLVATVWQQQVLGCFQQIWCWRHGVDDEALPWTLTIASSALRGALRHAFHQAGQSLTAAPTVEHALRRMLHGLAELQLNDEPSPPVRMSPGEISDRHLLFFDGGSRGNPGPGGSGAVMVRVDAFGGRPYLVWAAAMSLASPTTTNNQAEYFGLVTGLRYAFKQRLQAITIIGDRAMITSQLRDHRAPKDERLRRRYAEARVMADKFRITQWCHHVRAFNKMAVVQQT